jgi:hypothetical protein
MAEFFTNYPQAQKPMSLGDMLNMAGGVQQYQQAKQMNPLALQKAQMEVEQSKQMNPLTVQKAQEEVSQAQIGTQEKQYGFNEKQAKGLFSVIGGIMNDKRLEGDRDSVISALLEAKQRAAVTGTNPIILEGVFAPLMNQAVTKHQTVKNSIGSIIQQGMSSESQQGLQTPQLTTGPSGSPATYQSGSGTLREANIGGGGQPTTGGGQATTGGAPTGVTQTQMGLSYPVRKAGDIRPVAPNELADTERGAKYRNDLTTRQTDLSKSRRNLDEVIEAAGNIAKEDFFSTGVLGAATRTIKGALGDEKYKQLSKDLANVQISNMQAMGGSMETDAGKQLIRMANGDETYPPEVLKKIARRTYSDLTNLDMQATGAAKFAKKYGDSNLNTFKQQWSQNADSKVFEAMALYENIKDPAKRKEEIDKLMGNNPEQRQEFFQKYNNIKKLTATGEL